MISPLFVIVILVLLFWYLTSQPKMLPVCPARKCQKEKFTDEDSNDKTINIITDDQHAYRANSTGLKTTGQFVNSAFETPVEDQTFNEQYAKIIADEIGQDVVDSQQLYIKSVPTDNRVRFIDTDISTQYTPYVGISLSRLTAPPVNSSNSTQIQSVDVADYNNNVTGSLRSFMKTQ